MIKQVRSCVDIPIIVGGGIRDASTATDKIAAGADIIVTGNLLRSDNGIVVMKEIAQAVARKKSSSKRQ
jgi:heptaprenylglyceryl phosphate synthase